MLYFAQAGRLLGAGSGIIYYSIICYGAEETAPMIAFYNPLLSELQAKRDFRF